MFHDRRDRIDRLLLKPLWCSWLIFGVIYAFRLEFFNAVTFGLAAFFGLAWIAGGLFPDRSPREMANPERTPANKVDDDNPIIFMLISRATFRLGFVVTAVLAIIGWHAGARWLPLIGVAVLTYVGVWITTFVIVCFPFRRPA